MKHLLIILAILTVSLSYSQGTIQISPHQAKEAIKAKQRVQVLESALQTQGLILTQYKMQAEDHEADAADLLLSNELWKKNYQTLEALYEAEKAKKPKSNWLTWTLGVLAAFGGGIVVGLIN